MKAFPLGGRWSGAPDEGYKPVLSNTSSVAYRRQLPLKVKPIKTYQRLKQHMNEVILGKLLRLKTVGYA
jgi:hypothetical protein